MVSYFQAWEEYIVSFCPNCDCQRYLKNLWYLYGKQEKTGMYYVFDENNKLKSKVAYYCEYCDSVIYKDITESRPKPIELINDKKNKKIDDYSSLK